MTRRQQKSKRKEEERNDDVANGIFFSFPFCLSTLSDCLLLFFPSLSYSSLRFTLLLDLRLRPVGLQPPASDSPKHQQQQKIDKNSPGYNNNSNSGSGVGSSATLPSQGSAAAAAAAAAAQHLPLGSVEAQLKYENDRLKLALAQR